MKRVLEFNSEKEYKDFKSIGFQDLWNANFVSWKDEAHSLYVIEKNRVGECGRFVESSYQKQKAKYYEWEKNSKMSDEADKEIAQQKSKRIVEGIKADLTGRRGLRQEWEQIDEDIQNEIIQTWIKIAQKELYRSKL